MNLIIYQIKSEISLSKFDKGKLWLTFVDMPDSTSIEHFIKTALLSYGPQIEGGKIQVSVAK